MAYPVLKPQTITNTSKKAFDGWTGNSRGPLFQISGKVDKFVARNGVLSRQGSLLKAQGTDFLTNAVIENIKGVVTQDGVNICGGSNVVVRNVDLTLEAPAGVYVSGFHFGAGKTGAPGDVITGLTVDSCRAKGFKCLDQTVPYPNGDSFGDERGTTLAVYSNLWGEDPMDANYDFKSTGWKLIKSRGIGGHRGLRCHVSGEAIDYVSDAPNAQCDAWIGDGSGMIPAAILTLTRPVAIGGAPGRKFVVRAEKANAQLIIQGVSDKNSIAITGTTHVTWK